MGRIVPEKNLHHIIEAFAKLKNKDDIKLVFAGDTNFEDNYSRNLKEMARNNGVVLTGFIKGQKLHSLLTNTRCFVLPSSHEGLPIALLEAMSYNVPVIVSDIPATKEVGLPEDCYFPVGDIDSLTKKLQQNIDSDYQRVEYELNKYDWDCIANQVEKIYSHLGF
jgi:glycosyltransferase involved in cell wall biosynthesis